MWEVKKEKRSLPSWKRKDSDMPPQHGTDIHHVLSVYAGSGQCGYT